MMLFTVQSFAERARHRSDRFHVQGMYRSSFADRQVDARRLATRYQPVELPARKFVIADVVYDPDEQSAWTT